MSTLELRRRIKKKIDSLPDERLQSAADYLSYLKRNPDRNPQAKLIRFRRRIAKAEKDIAEGRFVTPDQLRRKS